MAKRPTSIRLTENEIRDLDQRAARANLTRGRYIRLALLGEDAEKPHAREALHRLSHDQAETIRQLSRIGNNINQLARATNAGTIIHKEALEEALSELIAAVRRIAM
jgi:hypothetical protein